MFSQLSPKDDNDKALIKKYKKIQKTGMDLTQKVFEQYMNKHDLQAVARSMGIDKRGTLMLESEEEFNAIMDFSLFEYLVDGKNLIERYLEETQPLSDRELEVIEAQKSSYTSLFRIDEVNSQRGRVRMSDLLNEQPEIEIININLSQTASEGLLMFTRIFPFNNFKITSGLYFIFPKKSEKTLLRRYKTLIKRSKLKSDSAQRFVVFFRLNRQEGLETGTMEV